MNILVLGSGAREHALASKIAESRSIKQVFIAPGNGLAALDFTCHPVDPCDSTAVVALARTVSADLVVVGPEAPLLAGVSDALRQARIAVVGPSQSAAMLEGSKAHSKRVMMESGIPTAPYKVCNSIFDVEISLQENPRLLVVKADGLMAGKGVTVCATEAEALTAAREAFAAGQTQLVLERKLVGPELSLLAFCDGENYRLLPLARDYKRALDADQGKNTGGMGSYAPITFAELTRLGEQTIRPVLQWQKAEGCPYRGFLFAGLMFEGDEVFTLEYNVRLGDPETQSIMTILDGDIVPTLFAMAEGSLLDVDPLSTAGTACCVVLAASGYPDKPELGSPIVGIAAARKHPHVRVFGAGVKAEKAGPRLVSAGGRILSVVGHGDDIAIARSRAYAALSELHCDGAFFRQDIAIA